MLKTCSICGRKNLLLCFQTRSSLCLCATCFHKVPNELTEYAINYWNKVDFEEMNTYREMYSDTDFNETTKIESISLDEPNGLYRLLEEDMIYSFDYLSEFQFGFEDDEVPKIENGMKKVDYVLRLTYTYPQYEISVPIERNISVPADAPDESLSDYISKTAADFATRFVGSYKNHADNILSENLSPVSFERILENGAKEVLDALKIMEYESLDGVSKRGLLRRKQSLLKPEKVVSLKRAQEINKACDLLIRVIEEMEKELNEED